MRLKEVLNSGFRDASGFLAWRVPFLSRGLGTGLDSSPCLFFYHGNGLGTYSVRWLATCDTDMLKNTYVSVIMTESALWSPALA